MTKKESVISLTRKLSDELSSLTLEWPGYIYDPLEYARAMHEKYLELAIRDDQKVMLLGMNPGPFGMMQDGVPFGDIVSVRGFLGLDGKVEKPALECPMRPIEGMDIKRREMSGRRIWGAVESKFTRDEFFSVFTVMNWCPLCFLDEKGRNVTPDKLSKKDRAKIMPLCDRYIKDVVSVVDPEILVGVGNFAADRMKGLRKDLRVMPHPSPLNRGSAEFYPEKAGAWLRGIYEECIRKN